MIGKIVHFRSRPREITAVQYQKGMTPEHWSAICCGEQDGCVLKADLGAAPAHVHTMHDNQIVELADGDWIVPEPDGVHFYPIKPRTMEQNYERVRERP